MKKTVAAWLGMTLAVCGLIAAGGARTGERPKVLGLDKIIAMVYYPEEEARAFKSATYAHSTDWKYWSGRGGIAVTPKTWQSLLTDTTVEQGVAVLAGIDFKENPRPLLAIDELGFDEGGETDQKSAQILEAFKTQKPQVSLGVYQMRGPVPEVLAKTYKKVVDLLMMECYVGDVKEYWWIASQLHAARLHGLLEKAIVLIGLGVGGQPGENWVTTKEELERQIRFIRLVAPESPGVGFFKGQVDPAVTAYADELCDKFTSIPTDGAGLPPEALEVHKLFSTLHERPMLVTSASWSEPDRSFADPHKMVHPYAFRLYIMNLGSQDAKDVKVRLANPKDQGGDVFAEGTVGLIPKQRAVEAVLSMTQTGEAWKVWKTWEIQIEAPGCDTKVFPPR